MWKPGFKNWTHLPGLFKLAQATRGGKYPLLGENPRGFYTQEVRTYEKGRQRAQNRVPKGDRGICVFPPPPFILRGGTQGVRHAER